ncbi:M23 family metallopeptidase [Microbacterium sp.]|uniref:M23 family metallopeptidase n=1 Tax=Microbacterium sp. TaxID=51671 RepID=UPI0039E5815D
MAYAATGIAVGAILTDVSAVSASAAVQWVHPLEERLEPSRPYGSGDYPQYSFHRGLDYGRETGTSVLAAAAGAVIFAGVNSSNAFSWAGNHVIIRHSDGWHSLYAHMSAITPNLLNKTVQPYSVIGKVGSTGIATGPHLHIEIWSSASRDDNVDPYPLVHRAPLSGENPTEPELQAESIVQSFNFASKQTVAAGGSALLKIGDDQVTISIGPSVAVAAVLTLSLSAAQNDTRVSLTPFYAHVVSGVVQSETSLWSQTEIIGTTATGVKIPIQTALPASRFLRVRVSVASNGSTLTVQQGTVRGTRFFT